MDETKAREILELGRNLTEKSIQTAYREQSMVWHPDRFAGQLAAMRKRAEKRTQEINEAREILIAQLKKPASANQKSKSKRNKIRTKDHPPTGGSDAPLGSERVEPFEEHYWNGKLKSKGTTKEGLPHGQIEHYFRNGRLDTRGTYKNGWRHGPWVQYHKDGRLFIKAYWVALGDTETEAPPENMDDESVLHGLFERSEDGSIDERGTFNMGEKCGEWLEYGETVTYDPCPPDLADGN